LRNYRYLAIATVLLLFSTQAGAVELGKIDVVSHLGEAFHAEVPLTLDEGEMTSNLFVKLASPADYGTLSVHRNQALSMIHADVERGSRGHRIVLSSRYPVDAPYFTLVLKVRYGRVTHYKKYPVFLDVPGTAQPSKRATSLPAVSFENVKNEPVASMMLDDSEGIDLMAEDSAAEEKSTHEISPAFKPFDGWARTSRYGPIVYGDSIYTVADRLRLDERYTLKQIMVALFEKNRSQFEQDNINLLMHGTYLDVPMAQEVERLSYEQALGIVQEHGQRWKELVQQPHYAAVAEAQRTRYSKRVRDAEAIKAAKAASGMAAAPVSGP
jgi:pilus assembly protein FimV